MTTTLSQREITALARGSELGWTDRGWTLSALEQWVDHGKAPDRIVASRRGDGRVVRARPLCPCPQSAVYTGTGDTNAAENFVCRVR